MKKYIISILVAPVFLIGIPFLTPTVQASNLNIRDFINLLVAIGVITPDKMATVNAYLATIDNKPSNTNPQVNPSQNFNLGKISIRAIVANIDEVGERYGSMGTKFTQSKLNETEQALQKLNTFVKQSSYGKAELKWNTSGVYELGSGVCNHTSYGDKTNDLIQRALAKADLQAPIADYSYYLIVHPMPDCSDGQAWSFEGAGQFKAYTLNGRTVNLRGIRISDLSDEYLFHEFGHSLAYKPNTGIGHPDYLNCSVTTSNGETKISLSNSCPRVYDWNNGIVPVYTIMSAKRGILSDYSAIEKETIGWLASSNIVTTTLGKYTLSPIEQIGSGPKALKIPVTGTDYNVYVSFRQPIGYTYPSAPTNKPNGVILDISNGSVNSFLVTNNTNMDTPLQVGKSYRLSSGGPVITVNNIKNNLASVTISSESTTPPIACTMDAKLCSDGSYVGRTGPNCEFVCPSIPNPTCSIKSNKSSYSLGETITYSWTSKNATYANWQQDTSGKEHFNLPEDKLDTSGSIDVTANIIGNPVVTLVANSSSGSATCSKTVTVEDITEPTATILTSSQISATSPYIMGIASGVNQVGVVLISESGDKVYGSGLVSVINGDWSVTVTPALSLGNYTINVYDANNNQLTSKSLSIVSSI